MARISTYLQISGATRGNASGQVPGTMLTSVPSGMGWGFAAPAQVTAGGQTWAIPAAVPALLWPGTTPAALALDSHAYVIFCLPNNGQLYATPQENWAAVVAAQAVCPIAWVDTHHDLALRLPRAAAAVTPYAALLHFSYSSPRNGADFRDPWYGTLTHPTLNYPGLSVQTPTSPFSPVALPASAFTNLVSRQRLALDSAKHALVIDEGGKLWGLTSADTGGPGTQVVFPALLANPAAQYCLGVCRDSAASCWWALVEESNALPGKAIGYSRNFVPFPSSGTITAIALTGGAGLPSITVLFWDGTRIDFPTFGSVNVAINPDANGDMVIVVDKSGTAACVPGRTAPNDGRVALCWVNVVGSTYTFKASLANAMQRLPSDGAVGSPVPLRRSVAILKSTATLPSVAGDWTIAATLAADVQPPIEDQFLGIGAGGAVLAYQMDATLGPVWVSTGLTHLSFYGVDGTQSTAVGPTVGGLEWGMAVVNGQAWITGGGTVSRYHSSGELIGSFFSRGFTRAMLQVGAVVWLAEYDANLIDVYTLAGVFVTTYSGNGLAGPNGLALVGDQVWVANATNGNTTISRFNLDGTAAGVLSDPSLSQPWSLCVAGDVVWVSNVGTRTISRFTMDGTFYDVISLNTLGPPAVQNLIAVGSQVWLTAGGSPGYGIYRFNFDGSFVGPALSDAHGGNPFTLCLVPGGGGIVTMSPPTIHSGQLTVQGGGAGTQPAITYGSAWVGGQWAKWDFGGSTANIATPADGTWYLTLGHDQGMTLHAYASLASVPATEVLIYQVTISGGAITSYTPYMAGSWQYGTAAQWAANSPLAVSEAYNGQIAAALGLNYALMQGMTGATFTGPGAPVWLGNGAQFIGPSLNSAGMLIDPAGLVDTTRNWLACCDDGAGGLYAIDAVGAPGTINTSINELWHRAGDHTKPWVQVTTGYGTGGTAPGTNGNVLSLLIVPPGVGNTIWVVQGDFFQNVYLDVITTSTGAVTYGSAVVVPLMAIDFVNDNVGSTDNPGNAVAQGTEWTLAAVPLP